MIDKEVKVPEGFTRWDGECRFPDGVTQKTIVSVMYRDGVQENGLYECPYLWRHDYEIPHCDIIAYRVVTP